MSEQTPEAYLRKRIEDERDQYARQLSRLLADGPSRSRLGFVQHEEAVNWSRGFVEEADRVLRCAYDLSLPKVQP